MTRRVKVFATIGVVLAWFAFNIFWLAFWTGTPPKHGVSLSISRMIMGVSNILVASVIVSVFDIVIRLGSIVALVFGTRAIWRKKIEGAIQTKEEPPDIKRI
jgi:hypothetical protein